MPSTFDIAFIGHYTRDTIVTPKGTTTQDGGAFLYGCHVARRMGLATAVVTRLSAPHLSVLHRVQALGAAVFATQTPESTALRLVYPTENPDQRTIYVEGFAGPFTVDEVRPVTAHAVHIGASMRGEVPLSVIQALAGSGATLSLDAQGFVRVNRNGTLVFDSWPEKEEALRYVQVLKVDSVEAEILTGLTDRHLAAQRLASWGPREVVLTHSTGVLVYAEEQFYEFPFVARSLAGRTGRGDTCIAAYLACRLRKPPSVAAMWAAALTSLKMETPGPFAGTAADVERLITRCYI